ncbi:MAG: hypothetical protein ABSA83_18395 [Verrucomicrobiota bacterium]|jgi:hypothetical protein
MKSQFSSASIKQLSHYVYVLVDPKKPKGDPRRIFYVGKGHGNRCFAHKKNAVEILRHGLSKEISLEVEASVIDVLGLENLTNEVRGHGVDRGRETWTEMERRFGCKPCDVKSFEMPHMLYFINETYSPTMDETAIYDCARQFWPRAQEMKEPPYPDALAIVGGVVVRAYSIMEWFPAGTTLSTRSIPKSKRKGLWEFVGQMKKDHHLVGKRLEVNGMPLPGYQRGYKYFGSAVK